MVGCGGDGHCAIRFMAAITTSDLMLLVYPVTDRARIRAMYTHPDHVKKEIGKMILESSEAADFEKGFKALEMAATLAGQPFYRTCGYCVQHEFFDENGTAPAPLRIMVKHSDQSRCLEKSIFLKLAA